MSENEVDNKYIENAITHLVTTVGVKEFVDGEKIVSLVESKKVKEAIKEIAKYLGLPIEVNLSYVPKGYRANANDGFQSTHLVKTDWRGRGSGGITAQVSIPSNLPMYGSSNMVNFPISVRLSEDCAENPATLVSIMAHELSHIVLYSLWHKEKENEFYTDLTAMLLGFANVMRKGRKVIKTDRFTEHGFLSTQTTTHTQTTTYGYLSDDNFDFAYPLVEKILSTYQSAKKKTLKRIKGIEKDLKKQKTESVYFKKYLEYVGRNLNKKIAPQDGQWIMSFHQADYTDEFDSAMRKTENDLKQFHSFVVGLNQYSESRVADIKSHESKVNASMTSLSSKYDRIRGAVIILKRYVSAAFRLRSFLTINMGMAK